MAVMHRPVSPFRRRNLLLPHALPGLFLPVVLLLCLIESTQTAILCTEDADCDTPGCNDVPCDYHEPGANCSPNCMSSAYCDKGFWAFKCTRCTYSWCGDKDEYRCYRQWQGHVFDYGCADPPKCEPGAYSPSGMNGGGNAACKPCTAPPGNYCPEGSTSATGIVCPVGFSCAGGADDKQAELNFWCSSDEDCQYDDCNDLPCSESTASQHYCSGGIKEAKCFGTAGPPQCCHDDYLGGTWCQAPHFCPTPPACRAGEHSPSGRNGGGSAGCRMCIAGKFSLAGSTNCSNCAPGTYADNLGSINCTLCPVGTFSAFNGA